MATGPNGERDASPKARRFFHSILFYSIRLLLLLTHDRPTDRPTDSFVVASQHGQTKPISEHSASSQASDENPHPTTTGRCCCCRRRRRHSLTWQLLLLLGEEEEEEEGSQPAVKKDCTCALVGRPVGRLANSIRELLSLSGIVAHNLCIGTGEPGTRWSRTSRPGQRLQVTLRNP